MKLSIAIICSNDHLLKKCLDSIPAEVPILAVLNYPDKYIQKICEEDSRVTIIRCDEKNLGKLRQLAADNCKTKAICYVDSDCIIEKDLIKILEKELDKYDAVNIPLHFAHYNYLTKITSICRTFTTPDKLLYMPFAFNLDIQKKIGKLFNDKLYWGEDSDQRKRMKEKNIKYYISKSFVTHKALTFKEDSKSAKRLGQGTYIQEINGINTKRSLLRDISIIVEIKNAYQCYKFTNSIAASFYHFFIWRPSYKYGYWKERIKNGHKNKNN